MDDLSYLLAVCKKYGNAKGRDSKHVNAIDISTGRGRCRRRRVICRESGRRRRVISREEGVEGVELHVEE